MIPRLTSGARHALGDAGLARRRFLQQSGALIVAFGAARYAGLEPRLILRGSAARRRQYRRRAHDERSDDVSPAHECA